MTVTIYDVAKQAGVSIATVSHVINGTGRVSETVRQRVKEAIKTLNFEPNMNAASLTRKKTHTLGLIVPDISNPFFAELARLIEDESHRYRYSVFFSSTDHQNERLSHYISVYRQKRVDGIILSTGLSSQAIIKTLQRSNIPIILLARTSEDHSFPTITIDDLSGGKLAASHLLEKGYYRFVIFPEMVKTVSCSLRQKGFIETIHAYATKQFKEKSQLTFNAIAQMDAYQAFSSELKIQTLSTGLYEIYIVEYINQESLPFALLKSFLMWLPKPYAIFACHDILALKILSLIHELSFRIPDDIGIIGFDDITYARLSTPPLTTIAQPLESMVRKTFQRLKEFHDHKRILDYEHILFPPELKIRQTT